MSIENELVRNDVVIKIGDVELSNERLINYLNNRAVEYHLPFFVNLEIMDSERTRDSIIEVRIEYTGDRFKLISRVEEVHYHQHMSKAALNLYFKCVQIGGYDKLGDNDILLFSDEVDVFKRVNLGDMHRFPIKFFTTLSDKHKHAIIRYFIEFLCGFDESTVHSLRSADIQKFNMSGIFKDTNLYDMATSCFDIKPWEMSHASKRTYLNQKTRMAAIDDVIAYYNLGSVYDIKNKHIASICPGLRTYYKNLDELCLEYTVNNGGIKNGNETENV